MNRITMKTLQILIRELNMKMGFPAEGWQKVGDRSFAIPGAYALDAAYGGYCLVRYANDQAAETNITQRTTARACYNEIKAYMAGMGAR